MRVVLDTNLFVSALLVRSGHPVTIYRAWLEGRFTLLICAEQLEELGTTLRKPTIAERIKPYGAGRIINQLRKLGEDIGRLPLIRRSPDPNDDFLLAMCEAGTADYLVTGDKRGLLVLRRHGATHIVSARQFVARLA